MSLAVTTQIFGKKVRKPDDIVDDIEFEYYALEIVEHKANDFIEQYNLSKDDIVTYKVKMKRRFDMVQREIRGGKQIKEKVEFMEVRIYLSYYYDSANGYKFEESPAVNPKNIENAALV